MYCILLLALVAGLSCGKPTPSTEPKPNVVNLDIPDVELLNQYGEAGKFLSETIGEKRAVMTFTFTYCTTICPILDGIFQRLQGVIGDQLGHGTVMLTLSVDPRPGPAGTSSPARRKR
jgi:cytochrome oxidase Cu insertion factor (SCO1/SenC/PrrC family)